MYSTENSQRSTKRCTAQRTAKGATERCTARRTAKGALSDVQNRKQPKEHCRGVIRYNLINISVCMRVPVLPRRVPVLPMRVVYPSFPSRPSQACSVPVLPMRVVYRPSHACSVPSFPSEAKLLVLKIKSKL